MADFVIPDLKNLINFLVSFLGFCLTSVKSGTTFVG